MLISRIHTSGCRESVNLNLLSYFIKKEDKEHYNLIYLKEILETKLCFAQKKKKKNLTESKVLHTTAVRKATKRVCCTGESHCNHEKNLNFDWIKDRNNCKNVPDMHHFFWVSSKNKKKILKSNVSDKRRQKRKK